MTSSGDVADGLLVNYVCVFCVMMNFVRKTRSFVSKSHINEEFCMKNDEFPADDIGMSS